MLKKSLMATALLAGGLTLSGFAQAECSDANWKDCAGKGWVEGDTMDTPLGSKWWPSMWGEGDQAGSTNWYTKPEVVLRGTSLIKEGKIFRLGHDYHSEMPMFGSRKFVLRIPGTPTGGPFGANKIVWHDEYLATEIGQAGTQFDGLAHIGVQIGADGDRANMRFYNGFTEAEMGDAYGMKKLGTEHALPIVGRGVLLDIAGARGVEVMNGGECASMDDVKMALEKQGMADFQFMEGDAILFRYGWEKYWEDPATYNGGSPGICTDTARWISDEVKAGVTGGDTWNATDPVPYPGEPGCAFCIHQMLQTRHGIVNQENLRLTQLVEAGTYVFAYMYSPVPIRGATGSIGSPLALK